MNNSNPSTESSSSPPSSSPVPSPMTDTVQYTACYSTQGDWHNSSCSPSNCTINTISPHTPFSPHQQPPDVHYIPQFDYKLNPNLSPLLTMASPYNYPNPNITFFNPYMARSCKRALNTSGSSVGSRRSPYTKKPRHNTSNCSVSTNQSRHNTSNCSVSTNQSLISNLDSTQPILDLDKTWVPDEDLNDSSHSSTEEVCSNNNLMCLSCTDMQPVVASCRSCPDHPQLCQLCVEAHKRVRLTREHKVVMMTVQDSAEIPCTVPDESYRKMSQVMQSLIDLIDIDKKLAVVSLDDSISSTTAELVRSWSVTSANSARQDRGSSLELKKTEGIIKENLIPIFSHADLVVKARAAAITKTLIEIKVVTATHFVDNTCIDGFSDMIDCDIIKVISSALDCLEVFVKEVGLMKANYSLIQLHSKLEKPLRRLKDRETGVTTSVKFKASRLVRDMEKILLE